MKVLYFNGSYYQFPNGIMNINDMNNYIKESKEIFIPFIRYETENCVHPYYIREEIKQVLINFSSVCEIEECEINVLSKKQYDERLLVCVEEVCSYCVNCSEDNCDDMKGHRERINLDGECFWKEEM